MTAEPDEYGRFLGPGEVQFVRVLPGPIERVWAYLTDGDLRRQWLTGSDDTMLGRNGRPALMRVLGRAIVASPPSTWPSGIPDTNPAMAA